LSESAVYGRVRGLGRFSRRFDCQHWLAAVILPRNAAFRGTMTPSNGPLDSLLLTIVLATLAVGLPILLVLAIRFLWDRNVSLGRSKEMDKLTWQLHRIASAMEHQMNLSFPAVQPGTEEARDLVYLQQIAARPAGAAPSAAIPSAVAATPATARPSAPRPLAAQPTAAQPPTAQPVTTQPLAAQPVAAQPVAEQAATIPAAAEQAPAPGLELRDPSVEAPRAGVNSMFGL
jgi:hypothetical protein